MKQYSRIPGVPCIFLSTSAMSSCQPDLSRMSGLDLCIYCHEKDIKHKSNFGPMSDTCHSENNWKEIIFDHEGNTNYRLLGKHQGLKCASCHKGRVYDNDWFRSDCFFVTRRTMYTKAKTEKKCGTGHTEELWSRIIGKPAFVKIRHPRSRTGLTEPVFASFQKYNQQARRRPSWERCR